MSSPVLRKNIALALLLSLLCSWLAHSVSQVVIQVAQEVELLGENTATDYHAKSAGDHFHSASSADHVHDTLQLPLQAELASTRNAQGVWPWHTTYPYPDPQRLDRPPTRFI